LILDPAGGCFVVNGQSLATKAAFDFDVEGPGLLSSGRLAGAAARAGSQPEARDLETQSRVAHRGSRPSPLSAPFRQAVGLVGAGS
jgi:hypothetical protein